MTADEASDADGGPDSSETGDGMEAKQGENENAHGGTSPEVEVIDEDESVGEHAGTTEGETARIERIETSSPEELAREIGDLRERASTAESDLEAREAELGELESQLKRTQADFQNYKKRAERRRENERERATEDLVTRLLDVRDNLGRALEQEAGADIRPGVESTVEEFDRVLDDENVATIDPDPGSQVDPQRHEVMMRVDSDQPEDTVAEVFQPGYEMGEKVLRPAQVTVSE